MGNTINGDVDKSARTTRGFYARLTMLRLNIIAGGSYCCCDIETGCDDSVLHSNMAYTALTLLKFLEAIVGGGALNRRVRIRITIKVLNQM